MSILRFSCVGSELYAPDHEGRFKDPESEQPVAQPLQTVTATEVLESDTPLDDYIGAAVQNLPDAAPIVIMIHGFQYDPREPLAPDGNADNSDNPHSRLFHTRTGAPGRATPWPHRLGFDENDAGQSGLAIAFGWFSNRDGLHLTAYGDGSLAAWSVLTIIDAVREHRPGHPVHLVAHSLGTHVALHALRISAMRFPDLVAAFGKVILMGGSEFVRPARITYKELLNAEQRDGAGILDHIEIFNFISRRDKVVSLVSGIATHGPLGEKHMIGRHGLQWGKRPRGWMDVALTKGALVNWVRGRFGLHLSADTEDDPLDHWAYYIHEDNTNLMREMLRGGSSFALKALRASDIPEGVPQLPKNKTSWAHD